MKEKYKFSKNNLDLFHFQFKMKEIIELQKFLNNTLFDTPLTNYITLKDSTFTKMHFKLNCD